MPSRMSCSLATTATRAAFDDDAYGASAHRRRSRRPGPGASTGIAEPLRARRAEQIVGHRGDLGGS